MKKNWIIFLIVVIVFIVAGVLLVKHRKNQLESIRIETKLPVPVDTAKVEKGKFINYKLYIGVLKSNRQSTVRARVQGQVSKILKREGDFVRKGDILIELDGYKGAEFGTRKALLNSINNQKKAIEDMEKTVENLRKIYNRDLNLYKNKAISKQALELSENRLKEGEIKLEGMKSTLANLREKYSFYTVKSPFNGVISSVIVNVGDVVMPAMPLINLENEGNCKLVLTVSSSDIASIKEGSKVKVIYNGKELLSSVSRVYPSVSKSGTGTVEVFFDSHPFDLPLGVRLSALVAVKVVEHALIVPENAVLTSSDKNVVFKVENNKVVPVNVRITGTSSDLYAIEGNIAEGDIVVCGSDSLFIRLDKGTEVITDRGE